MTRDLEEGNPSHSFRIPVAIVAILFMLFSIYAITAGTNWDSRLISETLNQEHQTEAGKIFFVDFQDTTNLVSPPQDKKERRNSQI